MNDAQMECEAARHLPDHDLQREAGDRELHLQQLIRNRRLIVRGAVISSAARLRVYGGSEAGSEEPDRDRQRTRRGLAAASVIVVAGVSWNEPVPAAAVRFAHESRYRLRASPSPGSPRAATARCC